ncbi:MAG TPA: late competence development ComFB family protein [Chroococcidiopsis sp.]
MSKTIINVAMVLVDKATDEILKTYPEHPHQQAFASAELRQRLAAYVLSRIPGLYVVTEESMPVVDPESFPLSKDQQEDIERLIHQGIQHVLRDDEFSFPEISVDIVMSPSQWFG